MQKEDFNKMTTGVKGTLQYLAPELLSKKRKDNTYIDLFSADMWAFGVMLYEMLYLKLPFDAKNPSEYKKAIMNEEIKFDILETL